MKKKISSDEIYKIIAKILKTTPAKVIKIDKLTSIKNWDSLAQLNILASLDKLTKGKSSKIEQLAELDSVKSIIQILLKKNLIKK